MQRINEGKNLNFPSNKWQLTSNPLSVVCPYVIWLNIKAYFKRSGLWTIVEEKFWEGKEKKSEKIPKVQILDGLCPGSLLIVWNKHLRW